MKSFSKSQSQRPVNNTQKTITGTKSVRKRPAEFPVQNLKPSDLQTAVEFCETMLRTATLLGNRLHELHGDTSTRVIQESLKLAQVNFDTFRARIQGTAQREAL